MLTGLEIFRRSMSSLLAKLQARFLALKTPTSLTNMLASAFLAAFGSASVLQVQHSALALLNVRGTSRRYNVLLLCLAGIGLWPTFLGVLLAWQLSGFYLLALAGLIFLLTRFLKSAYFGEALLKVFFGLGLVLIGLEWTLRQHSILWSLLGESELHFLLADGRLSAQILWMFVGFAVTWLLAFESWSILIGLVLVVAGSMSLNGAVALICGELLAHSAILWWQSRKLNAEARSLAQGYAFSSSGGVLVGFFLAGFLRDAFAWNFTFEASQLVEKSLQLVLMLKVVVLLQLIGAMTWGHFAARQEADEVQTGRYFPLVWWNRAWISRPVMTFIREKLSTRLRDLQSQTGTLREAESKIPGSLLKLHAQEMEHLSAWVLESDKGREKF
jgi:hypothetical protein